VQIWPIKDPDYQEYIKRDGSVAFTGQYIYLRGDADTDGSVRFNITEGNIKIEIRISGSWETGAEWGESS